MKKHENVPKAQCPLDFCDRLYYRYDKLLHHLRTSHQDIEEAVCPFRHCSKRMPLIILAHHFQEHRGSEGQHEELFLMISGKLNPDLRSCPIPSCKHRTKRLALGSMQEHIAQHTQPERLSHSDAILATGFHPASLWVICPVCKVEKRALKSFGEHFVREHIFTDTESSRMIQSFHFGRKWERELLTEWEACYYGHSVLGLRPDSRILGLRPYSEYASHALEVLRLYPDFAQHPLFDKYRPNSNSD